MKDRDGGPAFPVQLTGSQPYSGMTLRDWFAGQALAGYLTAPDLPVNAAIAKERIASECFQLADYMLEERNHAL